MSQAKSKNGKVCWFDLYAEDVARAGAFYSELFGWKLEQFGNPDWLMIEHKDDDIGGMISKRQGPKPAGQGPLIYFEVDSIEQTLERAQRIGGKVVLPKTLISEQIGSFAILADSEGNSIAVYRRD